MIKAFELIDPHLVNGNDNRSFSEMLQFGLVLSIKDDLLLLHRPICEQSYDAGCDFIWCQNGVRYAVFYETVTQVLLRVDFFDSDSEYVRHDGHEMNKLIRPGALMFMDLYKNQDILLERYMRGEFNDELEMIFKDYGITNYELP